ncbi:hypothetical protein CDAR_499101 [Caerostris darwini]|uniref:Uncharacterized protein n=1 Tax=Caerostris darwini TaxID=1538125 RepID=A0AAV4TPR4_9ARAC|nr:hypothetical protein CDAR_499101 [Caerostris darwini]
MNTTSPRDNFIKLSFVPAPNHYFYANANDFLKEGWLWRSSTSENYRESLPLWRELPNPVLSLWAKRQTLKNNNNETDKLQKKKKKLGVYLYCIPPLSSAKLPEALHALGQTIYDLDRKFMTWRSIGGNDQAATVFGTSCATSLKCPPPPAFNLSAPLANLNLLDDPPLLLELIPPTIHLVQSEIHPPRLPKPIR